MHNGGIPMMST